VGGLQHETIKARRDLANEERIRRKLLEDGHIDTVIGLPANLFYSTGIPVCILVLKASGGTR